MFQVSAANPDQNIETIVVPVERLELAFAPRPWPFARERCDEIVAYFTALRRVNPALWNGRVLMLHEHAIRDNAGWIYFPAGVPDLSDVDGSQVDLARSLMRETSEETGLVAAEFEAEQGWTTVLAGARIAQIKILRAQEPAASLRGRILAHVARESQPELADVRVVRGPADFDRMMPPYVTAFLLHVWK